MREGAGPVGRSFPIRLGIIELYWAVKLFNLDSTFLNLFLKFQHRICKLQRVIFDSIKNVTSKFV